MFIFSSPGQDCSSGPTDYAGNFRQNDWMSSFYAIFNRVTKHCVTAKAEKLTTLTTVLRVVVLLTASNCSYEK